jgi:hypothetical protein
MAAIHCSLGAPICETVRRPHRLALVFLLHQIKCVVGGSARSTIADCFGSDSAEIFRTEVEHRPLRFLHRRWSDDHRGQRRRGLLPRPFGDRLPRNGLLGVNLLTFDDSFYAGHDFQAWVKLAIIAASLRNPLTVGLCSASAI